ncbi:type VI secretion system tube protein TssD [Aquimarina aquimarini]|uniref:type VI secretion system tube protein TssD n=2 Tax=Aquimarina aquimarini TaxID=1191734 RepID=UPI001F1A0290|nr:type VI secretion system tube protein TssD [Aquimarina aquimarini]
MSFKAKLEIDHKTYTMLDCSFDMDQQLDHNGRPSARPRGGIIIATVELEKQTDLIEWMVSSHQTKSGNVTFLKHDGMGVLLSIDFSDAYCARLSGQYVADTSNQLYIKLKISAREVSLNGVKHINNWPVKK